MSDRWNRTGNPDGGDCRKLVTLKTGSVIWVGIRAWDGMGWTNNGSFEKDEILAWQDLPAPAYSDGLLSPMSAPTLPALSKPDGGK